MVSVQYEDDDSSQTIDPSWILRLLHFLWKYIYRHVVHLAHDLLLFYFENIAFLVYSGNPLLKLFSHVNEPPYQLSPRPRKLSADSPTISFFALKESRKRL